MKENFEVDINKLTEEEKEKFLELIEKTKAETISKPIGKRWKGKKNDTYYSITSEGDLVDDVENESAYDDSCYQFGNYFKTIDEADFAREKQFTYQQLSDYALEHNTEVIDWENPQQNKWFIGCNHNNNTLITGVRQSVEFINTVYFTSREIAENAIKEIGENNIKYYLFGVEN